MDPHVLDIAFIMYIQKDWKGLKNCFNEQTMGNSCWVLDHMLRVNK